MHFRPRRLRHSLPSDGAPAQHDIGDQFAQSFHSEKLVTITATVGPSGPPQPTGTVSFTSNGTAISGCTAVTLSLQMATCMTSTLAVGTDAIVAIYSGDANYCPSRARWRNWLIRFRRPCNSSPSRPAVWWIRDRTKVAAARFRVVLSKTSRFRKRAIAATFPPAPQRIR